MNQKQINGVVTLLNQQEKAEVFKHITLRNAEIISYRNVVEIKLVTFDTLAGVDIPMLTHKNLTKMFEDIIRKSIDYRFNTIPELNFKYEFSVEYDDEIGLEVFKIMMSK